MFTIKVTDDIDQLKKKLTGFTNDQLPFATAMALTKTAYDVKEDLVREMKSAFDRPTPYTLNSLYVRGAKKTNLEAFVWLKDEAFKGTPATKYLLPHIQGTGRSVKRFERWMQGRGLLPKGMYVVPASGAPLDQYGNLRRGEFNKILTQIQANPDAYQNQTAASKKRAAARKTKTIKAQYFVGRPGNGKLPLGVWARYGLGHGSAVKPVLLFVGQPHYKRDYRFHEVSDKSIKVNFPKRFKEAAEYAIQTAR